MNPVSREDDSSRGFASDNFAGVHPRIMDRLLACNHGHAMAYGEDALTAKVRASFSRLFGREVATHFVFNGTAANNLSLMAFAKPYGAVVCSDMAHVVNDESTAPERFLGMRLLPVQSEHGKIVPAALAEILGRGHGVHGALPVALTLTQPTELGTVYTLDELRTLVGMARAHGLGVHVDGARIGCAVASLGVGVREMILDMGVDILSFGGTKQGMLCGEAVVILKPGLGEEFPYWQKHGMQLASKMRFISAQFEGLLEDDLWIENGRHANAMARQLQEALRGLPRVEVIHPVEANAVFARIPAELVEPLQKETFFWPWDERQGLVRWMCAFDSQAGDIARFVGLLERSLR
ncbi:MAG TPA: beta-eliminating lyase-related protein [Holophaga sp.]|nr:beta-eliminating lyase-related protein [Holophaga sp.]HPS66587.1 beta-eliminating lyase-related protein [Holophaga sp.]